MTEPQLAERHDSSWHALVEQAKAGRDRAYAPYSRFQVGAALESVDGRVFVGCNVENASYPAGSCAERVALGHAVAEGARSFRRIVVATTGASPASPCGICRQALAEFGTELKVMSVAAGGEVSAWRLGDLLPAHFGPGQLAGGDSERPGGRGCIDDRE